MISEKISLSKIIVESRKRPIDFVVVADLQKSIEQQGLLQNIGVKQTEAGYRLVFGAHRLEAVKALGWPEIQARIFPEDTSDDECLLAELQENRIRNDLTGAERKAFAAEVGRLIAKLSENCQTDVFANGKNEINGNWVDDLAKTSNTPAKTIYNWWSAFCKETVEQFNALLKTSHCTGLYKGSIWRKEDYERAKNAIAPDGDGLGRLNFPVR